MKIISRPFSGDADKRTMAALSRQFPADNLRLTDLPYRFSSWACDDPENVRLWFDADGQLLAWAALQTPWWTIDFAIHPRERKATFCHKSWIGPTSAPGRLSIPHLDIPAGFSTFSPTKLSASKSCEQAGFASQANVGEDSWSKVWMQRPGAEPVKTYRSRRVRRPPAGRGKRSGGLRRTSPHHFREQKHDRRMASTHPATPRLRPGFGPRRRRAGWTPGGLLHLLADQNQRRTGRTDRGRSAATRISAAMPWDAWPLPKACAGFLISEVWP